MGILRPHCAGRLAAAALALASSGLASAEVSREYDLKAVFVYNLPSFVEWPPAVLPPHAPFTVGVLGEDPFKEVLDEVLGGEQLAGHPYLIRRSRRVEDLLECHLLFISASETGRLNGILARLRGRTMLTVSDMPEFPQRGGMVGLMTENGRIQLYINPDAAKAGGLFINSKLMELARIVRATERSS